MDICLKSCPASSCGACNAEVPAPRHDAPHGAGHPPCVDATLATSSLEVGVHAQPKRCITS